MRWRSEHLEGDAVLRFRGEICGAGTAEGTRLVIGRWPRSPFGSFADAMVERNDGHRILIAPTEQIAAFVTSVYEFNEVAVTDVVIDRDPHELRFRGGPLVARLTVGRRDPLGWLLRAVPTPIAASRAWATAIDPLARRVLNGVRTRGTTAGGREYYGALDRHGVLAVRASWDGVDLGDLRDIAPPVRFGFSSVPPHPSVVRVVTTVVRARAAPLG